MLTLGVAGACQRASTPNPKRVVITEIDTAQKPGDDFFTYANGIWYNTARISASQPGMGPMVTDAPPGRVAKTRHLVV